MSWKGRIIGTIIGFFFSPLGMVIGFCIGYFFFDKPRNDLYQQRVDARNKFTGAGGSATEHKQIIETTFRLMGYVARGAGRVNEAHIRQAEAVMDMMNLNEERRHQAIAAFNLGKSDDFSVEDEVISLKSVIGNNVSIISYLLEIQVSIAIADENLEQGEHDRLLKTAMLFGIRAESMERLIRIRIAEQQFARFSEQFARQHQNQGYYRQSYEQYEKHGYDEESSNTGSYQQHINKNELAQAYEILGVTPDTPWADVRRAHKKLMLKYHPDRLASQGLPPEMMSLYTKKAQDIQAAFALIKAARGEK